jgi:hypothetical protein
MGSWGAGTWDELLLETKIKNRMPRVKTGVSRMTDDDVLQLTENIIANATGKVELANSPVTLAQLTTLKTTCTTAMNTESMAVDNLATSRTERANAFVEMRAAIDGFAQHAGTVYKHDRAKLQAISLDVRSSPVPPGPLPAPVNLQSYTGGSGGHDLPAMGARVAPGLLRRAVRGEPKRAVDAGVWRQADTFHVQEPDAGRGVLFPREGRGRHGGVQPVERHHEETGGVTVSRDGAKGAKVGLQFSPPSYPSSLRGRIIHP